jgi:hypothetical protein
VDDRPGLSVKGEFAAGAEEAEVEVTATAKARPGTSELVLRAEGVEEDGQVVASGQAVLVVTVLFLPPQPEYRPDGDAVEEDGKGVKYYRRIAYHLPDGTRVPFVLVPQRRRGRAPDRRPNPPTFYIMEDKVSLALFRRFARLHPDRVKGREWEREGADGRLPVFGVRVNDAYAFASAWLGGNLPTAEQWDTAAGRYADPRGEGPYRGKWAAGRDDVALRGPRPVGGSPGDVSPFSGCRDMGGNGYEWTRTFVIASEGQTFPPVENPRGLSDNTLYLRGQGFDGDHPVRFADLDEGSYSSLASRETRLDKDRPSDVSFRVVIEP